MHPHGGGPAGGPAEGEGRAQAAAAAVQHGRQLQGARLPGPEGEHGQPGGAEGHPGQRTQGASLPPLAKTHVREHLVPQLQPVAIFSSRKTQDALLPPSSKLAGF